MSATTNVTREYLETIYNLTVEGDPVVGVRLAEKFGVSPPNVAEVLKRMERDGLIRMPGRGRGRQGEGIELTEDGRSEAEALLRQHRLAERFLADVLGMDWVQAHEEAHHLERGMSPAIEERLAKLLGNPRTCPHGNPIPTQSMNTVDYLREQHALRLSMAEKDVLLRVVLISEVVEDESALLTYLGQMEIMPGARVTVLERDAEDSSLQVRIVPRTAVREHAPDDAGKSAHTVALTRDLAAKIWVRDIA
ncbi:MAG TPA: metal-dependent transcriptional regulator [Chloroflexia bacterium]|nr:metal-dependent transcriptional regulator [Chloroflexia bacterium]